MKPWEIVPAPLAFCGKFARQFVAQQPYPVGQPMPSPYPTAGTPMTVNGQPYFQQSPNGAPDHCSANTARRADLSARLDNRPAPQPNARLNFRSAARPEFRRNDSTRPGHKSRTASNAARLLRARRVTAVAPGVIIPGVRRARRSRRTANGSRRPAEPNLRPGRR